VVGAGLSYAEAAPFSGNQSLGEALLTPTRLYVKGALAAVATGGVKALAHITGGGLVENVPRVLPIGLAAEIDVRSWTPPPVFRWLAQTASIAPIELARTFNCGIGMVVVVAASEQAAVTAALAAAGETVTEIGRIVRRTGEAGTVLQHLDQAWPA
jgi:phosphoribosylformylglycinamidine cyclo-ligase